MVRIFQILYLLERAKRRLTWDKNKLKQFQDKKLRAVVKSAYQTVPFYHRYFKQAGVDIETINGINDLSKLPFVTKEQLKNMRVGEMVSSLCDHTQLKKVRTSGSTGKPLEILIDSNEDAWRKSIYMRANIACGQKPWDRWVVLTAPHHFGDTTSLQRKLGIYSQTCISLFESNLDKVRQIEHANPQVLDGYSGALLVLAKELDRKNITTIKPRIVFGNAELIDNQSKRYLERVFDAPYCDQFGCAEVDRTAWQCLERNGYHMDTDSVITEFLDANGQQVEAGERGELAYTSLFNYSMPLIRYKIGDVGVPSSETCSCGNNLPLMKIVEGRKDSFLVLPNQRLVSPFAVNLEASSFRYFSSLDQYHIRQKTANSLEIYLKLNDYSLDQQIVADEFERLLRAFLGLTEGEMQLKTYFVDNLKISNGGKLASITSELAYPNYGGEK